MKLANFAFLITIKNSLVNFFIVFDFFVLLLFQRPYITVLKLITAGYWTLSGPSVSHHDMVLASQLSLHTGAVELLVVQVNSLLVFTIGLEGRSGNLGWDKKQLCYN